MGLQDLLNYFSSPQATPSSRDGRGEMQATPRNAVLGTLSDTLAQSYAPQRTQQMQGIAKFLGAEDIAKTLDRLSYGEPLTTGAGGIGGTTQIRPEVINAAMALSPLGMAQAPERVALTQAQKEANLARFLSDSKAPQTLYHGTDKSFSSFDPSKLNRTTWGEGFHLAEDPSLASQYAGMTQQGANVMPVHAAIKNPLELNSIDDWFYKIPGNTNAQKTDWVKSQGYDGIKYPHSQPTETDSGMAWVAFEPTQLKSAIGNSGAYDVSNPDITKAQGGMIDKPLQGSNKLI